MTVYLEDGILAGNWLTNKGEGEDEISLMFLGEHVMIIVFGVCNPNKPSTNTIKRIVCLQVSRNKSLRGLLKNNPKAYHINPITENKSVCIVSPYAPTDSSKMFILGHPSEEKWITDKEWVEILALTVEPNEQVSDLPSAYQLYWQKCEEVVENIRIHKPGQLTHKLTRLTKFQAKLAQMNRSKKLIEYAIARYIRSKIKK